MDQKYFIGQKVVCIENAFEHWKKYNFNVPLKAEIYTIREIRYFDEPHYRGYAIKLQEISNPVFKFPNMTDEVSWRIKYFVPLEEYISEELLEQIDITPLLNTLHLQNV